MRKFTSAEEIILKYLSSEYKYLTRDRNGIPYIHTSKPVKDNKTGEWRSENQVIFYYFSSHLFKTIKWQDREPCDFRNFIQDKALRPSSDKGFTDDEKTILKYMQNLFQYITRDSRGYLDLYAYEPSKALEWGHWRASIGHSSFYFPYKDNVFNFVKWADAKACEFRKYI